MENIIKDLQTKQLLVLEYLNKTYEVVKVPEVEKTEHQINGEVWVKADVGYKLEVHDVFHKHQIYGRDIESELLMMFGFGEYLTKVVLHAWLESNGIREIDEEAWEHAWEEPRTKLRTNFTLEMAQDLNAFHNIDAEAELTALLGDQVQRQIDCEIARNLVEMGERPVPHDDLRQTQIGDAYGSDYRDRIQQLYVQEQRLRMDNVQYGFDYQREQMLQNTREERRYLEQRERDRAQHNNRGDYIF